MICPLDLSVQQQHVYTLLYKRSDFNTMIVRYTAEQLALDSDKIFSITEKVARRILNQLQGMGYLEELEKGKKGTYTKWKICKERVINGQETGTYRAGIGQELGTNDKAIPTVIDVCGNELGRKRAPIGQETVSPISNKDKENDKKQKPSDDYRSVYNHHQSLGIKKHRAYTDEMSHVIKRACDVLKCDTEYLIKLLDRHSAIVRETESDEFSVQARGVAEFFGQKAYQSKHLICSEYDEGGAKYERYKYLFEKPLKAVIQINKAVADDGWI